MFWVPERECPPGSRIRRGGWRPACKAEAVSVRLPVACRRQVATGDINGDHVPDIIVGPRRPRHPAGQDHRWNQAGPHSRQRRVPRLACWPASFAFGRSSTAGVFVAARRRQRRRLAEIIVGLGKGGSTVKIIDGSKLGLLGQRAGSRPGDGLDCSRHIRRTQRRRQRRRRRRQSRRPGGHHPGTSAGQTADPRRRWRQDRPGRCVAGKSVRPHSWGASSPIRRPFTVGDFVAAGDVNGDGSADVIVGPATGRQAVRQSSMASNSVTSAPAARSAMPRCSLQLVPVRREVCRRR